MTPPEDYQRSMFPAFVLRISRGAWIAIGIAILLLIIWFIPPVWKLDGGVITVTQWTKKGGEQRVEVGPDKPGWIPAKNVSRHILNAFVTAEDSRFYDHSGLDFVEIQRSMATNWSKKRYARGASTITQQVVKMALLSRDKTIIRKMREAIGALLLEMILTKTQILEWYMNLAEFGDGVYGIKAAARHYFQTKPELLTIQQGAHLALVLPSPNGWSVGLRRRNLTSFGHRRYASIINNLRIRGDITDTQWLNALATGNFGAPVDSYGRTLARYQASKGHSPDEKSTAELMEEQEVLKDDALVPDDATASDGVSELPRPASEDSATVPEGSPSPSPENPEIEAMQATPDPDSSPVATPIGDVGE